jgi:hypothetical protein
MITTVVSMALLAVAVEAARTNRARGLFHIGLANSLLAGAAASVAFAPLWPSVNPMDCAGALAAAVLIRIMVDRRICPRHFRLRSADDHRYPQ